MAGPLFALGAGALAAGLAYWWLAAPSGASASIAPTPTGSSKPTGTASKPTGTSASQPQGTSASSKTPGGSGLSGLSGEGSLGAGGSASGTVHHGCTALGTVAIVDGERRALYRCTDNEYVPLGVYRTGYFTSGAFHAWTGPTSPGAGVGAAAPAPRPGRRLVGPRAVFLVPTAAIPLVPHPLGWPAPPIPQRGPPRRQP